MSVFENHIGKIEISENFLTELVRHTVTNCFGVADMCCVNTFRSAVSALTGGLAYKNNKGVVIRYDNNSELIIDLHIKVTYNTNITAAVNSIIHKVAFTVEETAGITVKKINVYVDDMSS